jgi:predicted small metal-binding protein
MARKYIDCRLFPSDTKCSVAISADTEDEVVAAAAQHAVSVHKHEDSPQLRQQIRASVKEGSPTSRGLRGAAGPREPVRAQTPASRPSCISNQWLAVPLAMRAPRRNIPFVSSCGIADNARFPSARTDAARHLQVAPRASGVRQTEGQVNHENRHPPQVQ